MKSTILLAALLACSEPSPATTYVHSNHEVVRSVMLKHANVRWPQLYRTLINPSAPLHSRTTVHFRIPWVQQGTDDGLLAVFDVWLQGRRIPGEHELSPCRVQIGPNVIAKPFPVDFLFELFEDRELGERVRRAVGNVPIRDRYKITLQVDGFHVRLEQFPDDRRANVELVIDGCSHFPSDFEIRHDFEQLWEDPAPDPVP